MYKLTTIIAGLLFTSVISTTVFANTVADNRAVAKVIKKKLSESEAEAILDAPYDGFVEIRGKARDDVFQFLKIKSKASFPDKRWEELALSIADQVNVPLSTVTTSSRNKPSATAYVYIYKNGVEGVNTAGARRVNVTDGDGDYMALLVIKQKAAKGNVSVQGEKRGKAQSKVYKFELDA
jgi:hypothetical protein